MPSPLIHMPNTEKHSGVSGIPTQLLVNHSGECPLRGGYAQSLTNWANTPLKNGGPQASWHWFSDPIAIVSMVDPLYAAWHASEANPMSEGFEQAGYARYSRAEWLTPEGRKSIDNHAWIMAQRMKANGIPHKWLTTQEVEAVTKRGNRQIKGLCNHRQIDPETRTDPGDNYPFDYLNERIAFHLGTAPSTPAAPTEEEDTDMLIIARDTAAADPNAVWIGNGMFRRHVPDPATLKAIQKIAADGGMKVFQNGAVQNLPTSALGDLLPDSVANRLFNLPIARGGAGAALGKDTSLGAVVSWFDSAIIGLAEAIQSKVDDSDLTKEEVVEALHTALKSGVVKVDVSVAGLDEK